MTARPARPRRGDSARARSAAAASRGRSGLAAPGAVAAPADPGEPPQEEARALGPRRRELTARLVHDVGKYLARTARNLLAGGAVDAALLEMLCRDLYGDARTTSPADRFAALAAELQPLLTRKRPAARGEQAELQPAGQGAPGSGQGRLTESPSAAAPLAAVAADFAELAGLEPRVRAGAPAAVARAASLALQIEQQLRALATAAPPPTKRPAR